MKKIIIAIIFIILFNSFTMEQPNSEEEFKLTIYNHSKNDAYLIPTKNKRDTIINEDIQEITSFKIPRTLPPKRFDQFAKNFYKKYLELPIKKISGCSELKIICNRQLSIISIPDLKTNITIIISQNGHADLV